MKDLADQAHQDVAVAIMTEQQPTVADDEQATACTQECIFCGHLPCGCGG